MDDKIIVRFESVRLQHVLEADQHLPGLLLRIPSHQERDGPVPYLEQMGGHLGSAGAAVHLHRAGPAVLLMLSDQDDRNVFRLDPRQELFIQ